MSFSGQIYPEETVGYFRIASDSGRQPIHPVSIGEFRIGSGASCHLRFGAEGVPEVQAVLSVERDVVLLQAVDPNVPVVVNGATATECRLTDGDLLEVGEYRLLFRLVALQSRITLDEDSFAADTPVDGQSETADRIVTRLGEQIELIEELSRTPEQAVAELMKAVTVTDAAQPVHPHQDSVSESSDLVAVRALMQKHHEASRIRLESLTQVLDNVVRQQKLIADTLEVMSDRIQALDADKDTGFGQRRASA